jgi:hypothetical protein
MKYLKYDQLEVTKYYRLCSKTSGFDENQGIYACYNCNNSAFMIMEIPAILDEKRYIKSIHYQYFKAQCISCNRMILFSFLFNKHIAIPACTILI